MVSVSEVVAKEQESIVLIYLDELRKKYPSQAEELQKYLLPAVANNPNAVEEFLELTAESQQRIANHLARISDLQLKVRNNVNGIYSQEIVNQQARDAASFSFVINKFFEKGITKDQMQKMINEIVISISMTAHPTNPYSVEYSAASMQIDAILATDSKDEYKGNNLRSAISNLIDIPPVTPVLPSNPGKKTQKQEVEEALVYMQNIYNSIAEVKRTLQKATSKTIYEGIEIGRFYDPCVWLAGDGDGNPNATAESLEENIKMFREKIHELYLRDLDEIIGLIENQELIIRANLIKENLANGAYSDQKQFLQAIQDLEREVANDSIKEKLQDLTCRVEIFGFNYAKIDVRHDASDINETAAEILFYLSNQDEKLKQQFIDDYKKMPVDGKVKLLSEKLSQDITTPIITEGFSETAKRVFGRLQVVAKNPGCSDKLIIAECKGQADALAALLLLKATGNSINKPDSLNIVTLSESAEDLLALGDNLKQLLQNETYRNHVIANGKLIYMIAKSDTQRRGGVGAQFAQEKAVEDVTRVFAELVIKYPELSQVQLVPFNGGGHALQRGGGRIDETPNTYTKSALRAIKWQEESNQQLPAISIQPPILTIQGGQNAILFSATNASHFFERYWSQSLWAKAKQEDLIFESEVGNGKVNDYAMLARQYREIFFKAAKTKYEEDVIGIVDGKMSQDPTRIDGLFANGPWASCNLGNVSSRPGKRNNNKKNSDALTVEYFKGKQPRLTDQRAIGAEKMCSHSMTHLLTWYSAKEGLEAVMNQAGQEAIALMYEHDKSTRDSFRSIAIALFMTDFSVSWQMLIGSNRPNPEELKQLKQEYLEGNITGSYQDNNKRTLAYIEYEANETAKLIYYAITKQKPRDEFDCKNLLEEFWPELAREISNREQHLKFSHQIEAKITSQINDQPLSYEIDFTTLTTLRAIYAAANATNAPTGSMNTLTKTSDQNKPTDKHVEDLTEEQVEMLRVVPINPKANGLTPVGVITAGKVKC